MAEIEIRGGRVVAVDTETLRNAAAQTELAVADADTVRAGLTAADRLLGSATIGGGAAYLAIAAGVGQLPAGQHRDRDLIGQAPDPALVQAVLD